MKLYEQRYVSIIIFIWVWGGSAEGHVQKWHFPQQLSLKDL